LCLERNVLADTLFVDFTNLLIRMAVSVIMIDNGYGSFRSDLQVPDGRDPGQNAWLTLTLYYSLNFADSKNPVPGVIVRQGAQFMAKDSDGTLFPIVNWDLEATLKFHRTFKRGEAIWNWQFVLITPRNYDGFDVTSCAGPGWIVRPNVLCLFRLQPGVATTHRKITVVRLDPSIDTGQTFRSNVNLYDYLDAWSPTLGHELGHALGMGHIKELMGDNRCIADAKNNIYPTRCYGETPAEKVNIMGSGVQINPMNAKPWIERIALHTERPSSQWQVTANMDTPPRKIPLGVSLVGMPSQF
jgi:hypothetical protein